jgi:hypothetical protein
MKNIIPLIERTLQLNLSSSRLSPLASPAIVHALRISLVCKFHAVVAVDDRQKRSLFFDYRTSTTTIDFERGFRHHVRRSLTASCVVYKTTVSCIVCKTTLEAGSAKFKFVNLVLPTYHLTLFSTISSKRGCFHLVQG